MHILTVDVEDWFHVLDSPATPAVSEWEGLESRVVANTERLAALFQQSGVGATFFVLGWVAKRYPALVRGLAEAGFEIGSHGHLHRLVSQLTPEEFADDLNRSADAIADACGQRPRGFRAPGFSITEREAPWAFRVLADSGFTYDASVFPGGHGHGGFRRAPAEPFRWRLPDGAELGELPVAAVPLGGRVRAFGGGGYFRLLPVGVTAGALRWMARREQVGAVYLHPREIDAAQPRLAGLTRPRRFKYYVNLASTEEKLRWLLSRFEFVSAREYWARAGQVPTRELKSPADARDAPLWREGIAHSPA